MRLIQEKVEDLKSDKKEHVILTSMDYEQSSFTEAKMTPDFEIYRTYLRRYK